MIAVKLLSNFDLWLSTHGIKTFEEMGELIVLRYFMRLVPEDLLSLILDWSPQTLTKASSFGECMCLNFPVFF